LLTSVICGFFVKRDCHCVEDFHLLTWCHALGRNVCTCYRILLFPPSAGTKIFWNMSMLVLDDHFPNFFGNGTLFHLVNIYGTHMFCDPSFIK
jgi:hypothetical protein